MYEEHGEELTVLNRETLDTLTWIGSQFWMVELLPWCEFYFIVYDQTDEAKYSIVRFLPDWTPGAIFKQIAAKVRDAQLKMRFWPWETAVNGFASLSFMYGYKLIAVAEERNCRT